MNRWQSSPWYPRHYALCNEKDEDWFTAEISDGHNGTITMEDPNGDAVLEVYVTCVGRCLIARAEGSAASKGCEPVLIQPAYISSK